MHSHQQHTDSSSHSFRTMSSENENGRNSDPEANVLSCKECLFRSFCVCESDSCNILCCGKCCDWYDHLGLHQKMLFTATTVAMCFIGESVMWILSIADMGSQFSGSVASIIYSSLFFVFDLIALLSLFLIFRKIISNETLSRYKKLSRQNQAGGIRSNKDKSTGTKTHTPMDYSHSAPNGIEEKEISEHRGYSPPTTPSRPPSTPTAFPPPTPPPFPPSGRNLTNENVGIELTSMHQSQEENGNLQNGA